MFRPNRRNILKSAGGSVGLTVLGGVVSGESSHSKYYGYTYDIKTGQVTGTARGDLTRNPTGMVGTLQFDEMPTLVFQGNNMIGETNHNKKTNGRLNRKVTHFSAIFTGKEYRKNGHNLSVIVDWMHQRGVTGTLRHPHELDGEAFAVFPEAVAGSEKKAYERAKKLVPAARVL